MIEAKDEIDKSIFIKDHYQRRGQTITARDLSTFIYNVTENTEEIKEH